MANHQKKYDGSDLHWSTERVLHGNGIDFSGRENDTFLSFCIEQDIVNYVESTLLQDPSLTSRKKGRPLLGFAVSSLLDDPSSNIRFRMCKILLKHGASPNETYRGVSPWTKVISHLARRTPQNTIWLDLVTAFISRNASMVAPVTNYDLGVAMATKSILEDTFLREHSTEQQSPRADASILNRAITASGKSQCDMRKGWMEIEQAHEAARSSAVCAKNYGTFNGTEPSGDSSVLLATLRTIFPCYWGVESDEWFFVNEDEAPRA
ncbi:hypothetical protein BGZ57DRAFT_971293 [Hyaloscypha finlandica]|nr:hypothetical protein BGZ57DRAFT_971293 [Hyaloscypha finlandica]